jgi:hypothetical protein
MPCDEQLSALEQYLLGMQTQPPGDRGRTANCGLTTACVETSHAKAPAASIADEAPLGWRDHEHVKLLLR